MNNWRILAHRGREGHDRRDSCVGSLDPAATMRTRGAAIAAAAAAATFIVTVMRLVPVTSAQHDCPCSAWHRCADPWKHPTARGTVVVVQPVALVLAHVRRRSSSSIKQCVRCTHTHTNARRLNSKRPHVCAHARTHASCRSQRPSRRLPPRPHERARGACHTRLLQDPAPEAVAANTPDTRPRCYGSAKRAGRAKCCTARSRPHSSTDRAPASIQCATCEAATRTGQREAFQLACTRAPRQDRCGLRRISRIRTAELPPLKSCARSSTIISCGVPHRPIRFHEDGTGSCPITMARYCVRWRDPASATGSRAGHADGDGSTMRAQ